MPPPPPFAVIYLRFVFQQLARMRGWTAEQMRHLLPSGVAGAYRLALGMLVGALRADPTNAHLEQILCGRILPLLVAVRQPPTPEQLAWLAGLPEGDGDRHVRDLLDLLAALFPKRAGPDGEHVVVPYHKVSKQRGVECDGMV
jgi:hypothetical protein